MKVLVVEDFEPMRTALAGGLVKSGFTVDTANDGEDGLWLASTGDYDVIVMDIMMPKRDGFQTLQALREKRSPVPVLLLTARGEVEDRIRGLDLGADDYLVKPFVFGELLARVRALIRRRYGQSQPVIRVGPLQVDPAARRAFIGERELNLQSRSFALLELLARRSGSVVTRETIFDHLYEFESEVESNTIEVYVARLRKELGDKRWITTRRGQGYLLEEPHE